MIGRHIRSCRYDRLYNIFQKQEPTQLHEVRFSAGLLVGLTVCGQGSRQAPAFMLRVYKLTDNSRVVEAALLLPQGLEA